jgi:hypothetical protein
MSQISLADAEYAGKRKKTRQQSDPCSRQCVGCACYDIISLSVSFCSSSYPLP